MTPKAFSWIPLLALAAGTLWTVTAEMLPAGLLLDIAADVGTGPGTTGYLVTVWGVAIALLSLPLTRFTRGFDRRTLLVGTLVLTGVMTVLTALAPTYALLLVARTLAAAAHGLFWGQVVVVGTSLVPKEYAGRAVAIIVGGPTVATVAAIPAATALGDAVGWRVSFALVGALIGLTGLLVRAVLPPIPATPVTEAGQRDPSVRPVVTVAVLGALLLVAHFVAYTFVSSILTGPGGLARASISLALLVFGIVGAVGLTAAPALIRRLPAASLPVAGAGLALALLALRAAGGSETLLLAAMGLWGLVLGVLPPVFQTRLLALASDAFRPTAGAVIIVAFNLGVASGAAAGGRLYGWFGVGSLSVIGAVLALAATAALGWVSLRQSRRVTTQPETDLAGSRS